MDVIQQLVTMGNEVVTWMQLLGLPAAAIAFGVGGFQQIFGGASALASFLKMKITF